MDRLKSIDIGSVISCKKSLMTHLLRKLADNSVKLIQKHVLRLSFKWILSVAWFVSNLRYDARTNYSIISLWAVKVGNFAETKTSWVYMPMLFRETGIPNRLCLLYLIDIVPLSAYHFIANCWHLHIFTSSIICPLHGNLEEKLAT